MQKADKKATVKPHPSHGAFPTFICRYAKSPRVMDGQRDGGLSKITLISPSCFTAFTQVHPSFFLFFLPPGELADSQAYRDITGRMHMLNILEERYLELMQQP